MAEATKSDPKAGGKQAPNPPSAAPSAAPTAADKKGKGKDRVKYPVPETGLEAWPTDYDPKKHKPLMRGDFKDEIIFLERKAKHFEDAAAKVRKEIEDVKRLGPGGTSKAKKLVKVTAELDALTAMLKAQGMDVDKMLEEFKAKNATASTSA